MEQLFKLPLTEEEEQCLHSYLSESSDSTAGELLVLHLLQRAQYVPAIRLNDRMKHRATVRAGDDCVFFVGGRGKGSGLLSGRRSSSGLLLVLLGFCSNG